MQTTFFYLEIFLKENALPDRIYYIKHMSIQPFYHSSGLNRNLMFNGNIYYVIYLQILIQRFTWGGRDVRATKEFGRQQLLCVCNILWCRLLTQILFYHKPIFCGLHNCPTACVHTLSMSTTIQFGCFWVLNHNSSPFIYIYTGEKVNFGSFTLHSWKKFSADQNIFDTKR